MTTPSNFYLVYIDESYDETHFAYSALFIDAFKWNEYFKHVLTWRSDWFTKHQIALDNELHATDFVAGRSQPHHNRNKDFRAQLFNEAINNIEAYGRQLVINAITDKKKSHLELFGRMLNRINHTLEALNAYGVLICDEGNEKKLTALVRTMKKKNIVPPNQYHRAGIIYNEGSRRKPIWKLQK